MHHIIQFTLYFISTQDTMLYSNDLDSVRESTFNPNRPTQFLVHGFIDDGTVRWMKVKINIHFFISKYGCLNV